MTRVLYFNINYQCNSNCRFCASNERCNNSDSSMSIDSFKEILQTNKTQKGDKVIINGGEPTLHKEFMEFLKLAHKKGAYIDLFTNGVKLYDENFAKEIARYSPMTIKIPFFSADPERHDYLTGVKGNYIKTLKGLDNLIKLQSKYKIDVEAKLLLSKATYLDNRNIFDMITEKFPKKSYCFSINPLLISNRVLENSDEILLKYSEMMDETEKLIEYIRKKGWYISIQLMPYCLFSKKYNDDLGNLLKYRLQVLYSDSYTLNKLQERLTSPKCKECILKLKCAGFPESYIRQYGDEEVKPIL